MILSIKNLKKIYQKTPRADKYIEQDLEYKFNTENKWPPYNKQQTHQEKMGKQFHS